MKKDHQSIALRLLRQADRLRLHQLTHIILSSNETGTFSRWVRVVTNEHQAKGFQRNPKARLSP